MAFLKSVFETERSPRISKFLQNSSISFKPIIVYITSIISNNRADSIPFKLDSISFLFWNMPTLCLWLFNFSINIYLASSCCSNTRVNFLLPLPAVSNEKEFLLCPIIRSVFEPPGSCWNRYIMDGSRRWDCKCMDKCFF